MAPGCTKVLYGLTPFAINNAASQRIFSVFSVDWTVYQIFDQNIIRNRDDFNLSYIAARKYGIHYMVINSKITYPTSGNMSFTFFSGGSDKYHYGKEISRFNKGVKGLWIITNK